MKTISKILFVLVAIFCVGCTTDADDDFDASKVCPVEGVNAYGLPNRGTFVDERDGRTYKYTTVLNRMWMAENLNYDVDFGYCYDLDSVPNYCETYGRMYGLFKEKKTSGLLDQEKLNGVCPLGWHVPTSNEWQELIDVMGGVETRHFLNESFDYYHQESDDDACSLEILAAGTVFSNYRLANFQIQAKFWTSTQRNEIGPYVVSFNSGSGNNALIVASFGPRMSIRCIRD